MAEFFDHKDSGALRTIGEVGKALGLKAHVLRYWEDQFPQLNPLKRAGGRRLYRPDDVALIKRIDKLVNHEGYTLKGARAALGSGASAPDERMAQSAGMEGSILRQLRTIRADLAEALAR